MKKLLVVLLSLLCLTLTACGPNAKETAGHIAKDYFEVAVGLYNSCSEALSAQKESTGAAIAETVRKDYLPKIKELADKLAKEKDSKETKALMDAAKQQVNNIKEFFNVLIENEGQKKVSFKRILKKNEPLVRKITDASLIFGETKDKIVNGKSSYKLTWDNFEKLKEGDDYSKVAKTLGAPGKLISTKEKHLILIGKITTETFEWKDGEKSVTVHLDNGVLTMKEAKGITAAAK